MINIGSTPNSNHNQSQYNLHPDLKQHAYEDQINSLSTELQKSNNNLMREEMLKQSIVTLQSYQMVITHATL